MKLTLQGDQGAFLHLSGELDMSGIKQLNDLLQDAGKQSKKITFDLEGLKFIDSSGVGYLLYESRKLLETGYTIKFKNLSEEIQELFDLLGVFYILGESVFEAS